MLSILLLLLSACCRAGVSHLRFVLRYDAVSQALAPLHSESATLNGGLSINKSWEDAVALLSI
jgi:hypothetical protein